MKNILNKAVVLGIALALSACGGGGSSTTTSTSTSTSTTTTVINTIPDYQVSVSASSTGIQTVYGAPVSLGTLEISAKLGLEPRSIQVLIEANGPLILVDLVATIDGQAVGTVPRPVVGINTIQLNASTKVTETRKIGISVTTTANGSATTMKASVPANGIGFATSGGTSVGITLPALSLAEIQLYKNGTASFQATSFTNTVAHQNDKAMKTYEATVLAGNVESIRLDKVTYSVVTPTTAVNPGANLGNFRLYVGDVQVGSGSSTLVANKLEFTGLNVTVAKGEKIILVLKSDVTGQLPYEKGTFISLTPTYVQYTGMASGILVQTTEFSGLIPVTIQLQ